MQSPQLHWAFWTFSFLIRFAKGGLAVPLVLGRPCLIKTLLVRTVQRPT